MTSKIPLNLRGICSKLGKLGEKFQLKFREIPPSGSDLFPHEIGPRSKLIPDGFDQHFQAAVHSPLTCANNKFPIEVFLGTLKMKLNPGALGQKQVYYIFAL